MKKHFLKKLTVDETRKLYKRPSINFEGTFNIVRPILDEIKKRGLEAAMKYAKELDNFNEKEVRVSEKEFTEAEKMLQPKIKEAIRRAALNIRKFHEKQFPKSYSVETERGIECFREFRAIENVGLYIPGGTTVLPSTMLMLGIPAKLAGCKRIVVCSPVRNKNINYPFLFAAKTIGIKEIYKIGGAQAIGLMAYGSEAFPRVDKIFGPGNQFVTAAKLLVSIDPDGAGIDMPAGPSEVLVIADETADPSFAAADLLSQAEHGIDSQVILVTNSEKIAGKVEQEINYQLKELPRKKIIEQALENSFILIVNKIDDAINFSNNYAPEHLILNFKNSERYKDKIINAGSVFLGSYSAGSAGDYASGTNHTLPTYGFAKSFGGLTVESFMKSITFQKISKMGLKRISGTVETLAEAENLTAHKKAILIRIEK